MRRCNVGLGHHLTQAIDGRNPFQEKNYGQGQDFQKTCRFPTRQGGLVYNPQAMDGAHDFTVCEAQEHTEIVVGMRSVYNLLNGLRRLHRDAMSEGFDSLAGEINEMYEDATGESLEDEV